MRLQHLHVTGCLLVFIFILQLSSTRLLPNISVKNDTYFQDLYKDTHFIKQTQQISNFITSNVLLNRKKLNLNLSTNQTNGLSPILASKQPQKHPINSSPTNQSVLFHHHLFNILNPSTVISSRKTVNLYPNRHQKTSILQRSKWSFKKEDIRLKNPRRKLSRRYPLLKNLTKFYSKKQYFTILKQRLDGSVKNFFLPNTSSDIETKNLISLPFINKTISYSNLTSQNYFSRNFSKTSTFSFFPPTKNFSVASKKNFFQTGYYLTSSPVADTSLKKTNKSNRRIKKNNLFKITRKLLTYKDSDYVRSFPKNNLYVSLLNLSRKHALIKKPKLLNNNKKALDIDKNSVLIKKSKNSKNLSIIQPLSLPSSSPPPSPSSLPSPKLPPPSTTLTLQSFLSPEFDSHNSTGKLRSKRSLLNNSSIKKIRTKRNFSKRDLSVFRNDYERRARLHNPLSASFLSVDDEGRIVSDPYLNTTSVIELIIWCVLPQSPLHPCSRPNYNVVLLRFVDTGLFLCTDRFAQLYTFKSLELKNLEECAFKHGTVFNSYDVYYSWKYPRRKSYRNRMHNGINRKFKSRIFKTNKVQKKFGKFNKVKNEPYTSTTSSLNNQIMKKNHLKNNTLIINYINQTEEKSRKNDFHLVNDTEANAQHPPFHNHLHFNRSQHSHRHHLNHNSSRHHRYRYSHHHLLPHHNDQHKNHRNHHHSHHKPSRPEGVNNSIEIHHRRRDHNHFSKAQFSSNAQPSTTTSTSNSVSEVTIKPTTIDPKASEKTFITSNVIFISTFKTNDNYTESNNDVTRNKDEKPSTLGILSKHSKQFSQPPNNFETSDLKNFSVNNDHIDNKPVENFFPFLKLTVLDENDDRHNDEWSKSDAGNKAKKINEFDKMDSKKHYRKKNLHEKKISYLKNNKKYNYNLNDNELNKEKNYYENEENASSPISNDSLIVDNKTKLIENNQTKNNLVYFLNVNKTDNINSINDNTTADVSDRATGSFENRTSQPKHISLPFSTSFSLSAILISYSSMILTFLGLGSSRNEHVVPKKETEMFSFSNIFLTNQTSTENPIVSSSLKQYYNSEDRISVKKISKKHLFFSEHLQTTPLAQKSTQNQTFNSVNSNRITNMKHHFKHALYENNHQVQKNSYDEHLPVGAAHLKPRSKYFLRTNKKLETHEKPPQNNDEFNIVKTYNLTHENTDFSGDQNKFPQKDPISHKKHHHIRRNAIKTPQKFQKIPIRTKYGTDRSSYKSSPINSSILSQEQQKQQHMIFQRQEQHIDSQLKHKRSTSNKQEKKRWYIGINEKGEVKIFKVKASQDNRVLFIKGWLNAQEIKDLKTTLEDKKQIKERNVILNGKSPQLFHSEVQNLHRHYRFRHRPTHKNRIYKGTSPSLFKASRHGTNVMKHRRIFADGKKHKNKNSNNLCNSLLRSNC